MILDSGKMAERMKALNDMGVEELAGKAGCTTTTVYNIKKGKSCNNQTARRIAHALKCKVGDLEVTA